MRHEGLLGIEPVATGFRFTFADGSPTRFAAFDRGVAASPTLAASPPDLSAPTPACAASTSEQGPRPAEDAVAATTTHEAEEDALKALLVLQATKREARDMLQRALCSLVSRRASIDASALVTEALGFWPGSAGRSRR
jgi:hypothetical protein